MKFAGGLAVLIATCVPLAVACGSADDSKFFSERGGASDPGVAGSGSATAGLSEGGTSNQRAGAGGTLGVAGRPSSGGAGKNSAGSTSLGGTSSVGGTGSAGLGSAGAAAGAGKSPGLGGNAGTNAGSGGIAGASAGASGSAGASAGSGGSSSGAGGVTASGGSSGSSGSAGSAGSAGAPVCPATAPQKSDSCDVVTPNSCFYAGRACSCLATSGGMNAPKRWECYGDGALCPDTKPLAGLSCKPNADIECPYPGNDYCVCSGNSFEAHWVCQGSGPSAMCTPNKPMNDLCSVVKTCSWGTNKDVACFCNGSRWGCEGGF